MPIFFYCYDEDSMKKTSVPRPLAPISLCAPVKMWKTENPKMAFFLRGPHSLGFECLEARQHILQVRHPNKLALVNDAQIWSQKPTSCGCYL